MVTNYYLKCNLCGKIHRLRWEVGNVEASFHFICPKCKNKISGKLSPSSAGGFRESLVNVSEVEETKPDYISEVSTEFLCNKIHLASDEEFDNFITPFLRNASFDEKEIERRSRVFWFANNIEEYKNEVSSIFSLFNNKSFSYLRKKLKNGNNPILESHKRLMHNYQLTNELDLLEASHQYLVFILEHCFNKDDNADLLFIMKEIADIAQHNREGFVQLLLLLSSNDYFKNVNYKFSLICDDFLGQYRDFVPLFMKGGIDGVDLEKTGITTLDADTLINVYKKCYEFIGEFIVETIALNNLSSRGSIDSFKNKTEDLLTAINNVSSKFNRVSQCLNDEDRFSRLFKNCLNNVLRNSEGHFDYNIDPFSQLITFSNVHRGAKTEEKLYLVELGMEVIRIFKRVVLVWEINYQLEKLYLVMICGLCPHFGLRKR